MASHYSKTKENAKKMAKRLRKAGCKTSIYKKNKGWGISSTKK
jgi:hypothetical protein